MVNYESNYQRGARRYEVVEHSNFILVPMLLEALKQINQMEAKSHLNSTASITKEPIRLLREAGFWIEDEKYRGHHLFGIRLPENKQIDRIKKSILRTRFQSPSGAMPFGYHQIYTIPKLN